MDMQQQLQVLLDKQAITDVINKHARSLDRMDSELMKSVYWEDAIEELSDPANPEQNSYNDNAHAFVYPAMEGFKALIATQHRISNILIEVAGNQATAESYVWAYHVFDADGETKESIVGGRHCYKFERRDRVWKISHRLTLIDWNQHQAATALWSEKFSQQYAGQRNKSDASYNYINI